MCCCNLFTLGLDFLLFFLLTWDAWEEGGGVEGAGVGFGVTTGTGAGEGVGLGATAGVGVGVSAGEGGWTTGCGERGVCWGE